MSAPSSFRQRLQQTLRDLQPAPTGVAPAERLRVALGAALGIFFTAFCSQWLAGDTVDHFWHSSSLGATALLIFALPSSPFAQPWAVVVGNLSAAMVGMLCGMLIDPPLLAATVAVPLAILVMMQLRAVHPPGAGLALYMVLQHLHDPRLLMFPFLFSLGLIVLVGVAYHRLTGRRYPHRQIASTASQTAADHLSQGDLDRALARYNEVLAISQADLADLLQQASQASGEAFQRHLGELRCADIMTPQVYSVASDLPLAGVWPILRASSSRLLPVVDAEHRLVGMIGLEQWLDALEQKQAAPQPSLPQRIRRILVRRKPSGEAQPQWVRDAMVPTPAIARAGQPILDILPLLCQGGLYHVPVLDDGQHLIGIITQTDLLRALNTAMLEA
ncbi:CBS domain-containing protein [Corticibacter populi]|uniref:CBS domain-containing protein n=1 Tax=Corticibacter populi TaxID=1550736 RepID=A0A3M6QY34_9BURK|nr:HPP family protein [Corticibacter populi]RMX07930.1 CBS domain-containing protein [Corticibacter populi]RZS35169.1 CBS domain-containing membrane protein [Corticibacter populi]